VHAKVDPPNYNFSLETLSAFYPGNALNNLEAKFGKPDKISDDSGLLTYKFYVSHIRYKFPVIVQVRDNVIKDMVAKLPSYFLHDVFLRSLQQKFGKQTLFKKVGEEAFYEWKIEGTKYIYSGACTITCFPVFFSAFSLESTDRTILEKMQRFNRL
jgi:hypothetical protein